MATGTYKKTTNTTATYGENSSANLALQNAINSVSQSKISVDSKYGPQTKSAYDSLVGQGYTYANGAFTKPTATPTAPVVEDKSSSVAPVAVRPIYENEPEVLKARSVDTIQQEKLAQAQGEISALNTYYDTLAKESRVLGEKNNRRTNAISTLTGLAGSSEANVAQETTDKGNKADLDKIESERNVAIMAALGKIRQSAVEQAKQEREDARTSEQDRITFREKAQSDAVTQLSTLSKAKSGVTLAGLKSTLSKEEYEYLIKNAGGEEMAKAILFENRPQDTLVGSPTNVGGHIVQYYKTPDGSIKSENVPLPEGVMPDNIKSITKAGDGSTIIIKNDGSWSKIAGTAKTGGGGSGTTYKSGKAVFTGEQLSQFSTELEKSKTLFGGDGIYVNPEVYQQAYEAWVSPEVGGLAKDFLLKFPPKKYVNPANTTLPSYLRSTTTTSKSKTATGRTP